AIAKTGDLTPAGPLTGFTIGSIGISGDTVAFKGIHGSGSGIYVGNGAALTTVIETGDVLFGQPVTNLLFAEPDTHFGFDPYGSGNLAFRYTLANGVSGVAMASPVPEPSTFALAAVGLVIAGIVLSRAKGG